MPRIRATARGMGNLLLVMAGGSIGAGLRYLFGRMTISAIGPGYPWGTMGVNLIGGLLMGCLAGLLTRTSLGETARLLLGVGVLGGFTTFSAFSLDAVTMLERGAVVAAGGYVIVSVVGSVTALYAGLLIVRGLT